MGQKKKRSLPMILFTILMVVTLLLSATAAGLYFSGRNQLTATVSAPVLPQKEELAAEVEDTPEAAAPLLDAYTIQHDGVYYQYNKDMYNVLLMGIDADNKPTEPLPYGSDIQADVLILAALDLKNNDMTLISLNRDIMCDFEVLNENGESLGITNAQLALSYSYGDGLAKSCQMTADAVSGIFYGLQIHNYGVYYMGGIDELTDTLGGVTVNLRDDIAFWEMGGIYADMKPNQEYTLNGDQAQMYLRIRQENEQGNSLRMQRQKEFMLALVEQALVKVKENPTAMLSLYDAVDDFILTDLALSRISYLATKVVSMNFTGDIISLTGEITVDDQNHMQMHLDQQALYDLMLDVFYEEVPE